MTQTIEMKQEPQTETIQCFQCKHWSLRVPPCETPQETYLSIIRERNISGKILGACTVFGGAYPMYDIESCKHKSEQQNVVERVANF